MKNDKYKFILNFILFFFIFGSLFTTLRVLIIGSKTSGNPFEYFFSALPDILVFSLSSFVMYHYRLFIRGFRFSPLDKIIFIYFSGNIIYGTILSGHLVVSLYSIRLTYLPLLFYFIARFTLNQKPEAAESFYTRLSNWYILIALAGCILYFLMPGFTREMTLKSGGFEFFYCIKRMGSLFWSPVVFGSFMLVFALVYYYKLYTEDKTIHYLAFSLFWGCLFLTVSRGAIMTYYIGWLMLALHFRNARIFLKSLACMILVIGLLWLVDHNIYKVLLFISDSTADTFLLTKGMTRVDLWIASFKDFLARPQGYGLGKAGHIAYRFFGKDSPLAAIYSTDGWYLKLANETGIFGLFTYFSFVVYFIIHALHYLKNHKDDFLFFLWMLFIVISIQNIVSNVNDFYSFAYLFWLGIAFAENRILSGYNGKN